MGKKKSKKITKMVKPPEDFHRQLKQIDMFEDATRKGPLRNERKVEWKTVDQITSDSGTPVIQTNIKGKHTLLQNNVILIGPRKFAASQRKGVINKQKPKPTTTVTTNMPKFELNEVPNQEVHPGPNFVMNNPELSFNPNQQAGVNTNQPVHFNPNQPTGFNPNQPGDFNPNQPPGFNPNQPVDFNPNQPASLDPNQPADFNPDDQAGFNQPTGLAIDQEKVPNQTGGFNPNQPDFHNNQVTDFKPPHKRTGYNGPDMFQFSYPKGIPKTMLMAQLYEKNALQINQSSQMTQDRQPNWILNDVKQDKSPDQSHASVDNPVYVDTLARAQLNQVYSPSEVYDESHVDLTWDGSATTDIPRAGQKRVSAFQRLGPQTQPKTPKITINVNLEKEKPVREVVDETDVYDDDKYSPVHLRPNVMNSTDETVIKYLVYWPWKKEIPIRRTVGTRVSKSAMILEQEKMEELYERDSAYFLIEVKGYPASWNKENVLDAVLESVKGKSFIPCFIDFAKRKCSFLVIKCKPALINIHRNNFLIHKDKVELRMLISAVLITLQNLDFIPRLILRKRIMMKYDGKSELDLSEFTLKEDISHFIYFPLNRISNQTELTELNATVAWNCLTDLNLSRNRLTSISGFNLSTVTPNLKNLDLSHNLINRITALLVCRDLPLKSLNLEGNPLCLDYIDQEHYIKVIKMMFPCVAVIDGEKLHIPGSMPQFKKHYCVEDAKPLVETFLEIFFPLLDSDEEQRSNIERMYDARAVMTITFDRELRSRPVYRSFRNMFLWARAFKDGNMDSVEGILAIMKLVNKWPAMEHDPSMFNVDVMFHNDSTTVLRISGVLKLTAKTLADDEHLLAFARTFVLRCQDGVEYKICNEMTHWSEPAKDYVKRAFQINTPRSVQLSLKLDSPPDKDFKERLLRIFMKLTDQDKQVCERCLEEKNWHFKEALEYFAKLLKMDSLDTLKRK